jgi:hypothetical protein
MSMFDLTKEEDVLFYENSHICGICSYFDSDEYEFFSLDVE